MGIAEKVKGLFKKKEKGAKAEGAPAGKAAAAPKARAGEFEGEGQVYKSLKFAADRIDDKVASGKIDDKRAGMFMAQLKDIEGGQEPDDQKLIEIGQVIGGIASA